MSGPYHSSMGSPPLSEQRRRCEGCAEGRWALTEEMTIPPDLSCAYATASRRTRQILGPFATSLSWPSSSRRSSGSNTKRGTLLQSMRERRYACGRAARTRPSESFEALAQIRAGVRRFRYSHGPIQTSRPKNCADRTDPPAQAATDIFQRTDVGRTDMKPGRRLLHLVRRRQSNRQPAVDLGRLQRGFLVRLRGRGPARHRLRVVQGERRAVFQLGRDLDLGARGVRHLQHGRRRLGRVYPSASRSNRRSAWAASPRAPRPGSATATPWRPRPPSSRCSPARSARFRPSPLPSPTAGVFAYRRRALGGGQDLLMVDYWVE